MITAMTTSALILIVLATLALSAYAAYLVRLVTTDGSRLPRRELPPSHDPDLFEARVGKFDLLDPATGSMRTA